MAEATKPTRTAITANQPPEAQRQNLARAINVVLGLWLFLSAFLWEHTPAQRTNTWLVGLACTIGALVAISAPRARYINTVLSVWLFISAFALPTLSPGTRWNNSLVAIAIFLVSLVGVERGRPIPLPRRRAA